MGVLFDPSRRGPPSPAVLRARRWTGWRRAPAATAAFLLTGTGFHMTQTAGLALVSERSAIYAEIVTRWAAEMGAGFDRPFAIAAIGGTDDSDDVRTIIVGGGRVGRLVADMMQTHGKPYVMIDSNPDLIADAKRDGYRAIFGDAARGDTLARLGVEVAPAVVLTMDEPVLAQRLVTKLRQTYPDLLIVARARDTDHAADLAHYFLRLKYDAKAALHWATINYQTAKEPDDMRLLTLSENAVKGTRE